MDFVPTRASTAKALTMENGEMESVERGRAATGAAATETGRPMIAASCPLVSSLQAAFFLFFVLCFNHVNSGDGGDRRREDPYPSRGERDRDDRGRYDERDRGHRNLDYDRGDRGDRGSPVCASWCRGVLASCLADFEFSLTLA